MRKTISVALTATLLAFFTSCATNPYSKTNRAHRKHSKELTKQLRTYPPVNGEGEVPLNYGKTWVGTTNFNLRKPNYVVIHHTAQNSIEHTLETFTLPRTSVSAHYVIAEDGKVYQMLNDYYRAWHGGRGKWGNDTDLNSSSIGIELDNNGVEPFAEPQIESLIELLAILKERHGIPTANFIAHSDMAPSRKVDPNPTFPWERLAEEGFGYWYDAIAVTPQIVGDSLMAPQNNRENRTITVTGDEISEVGSVTDTLSLTINPELALRVIGYDTSDLESAIRAFKLHFIQKDTTPVLTEEDLKILYNLAQKYL